MPKRKQSDLFQEQHDALVSNCIEAMRTSKSNSKYPQQIRNLANICTSLITDHQEDPKHLREEMTQAMTQAYLQELKEIEARISKLCDGIARISPHSFYGEKELRLLVDERTSLKARKEIPYDQIILDIIEESFEQAIKNGASIPGFSVRTSEPIGNEPVLEDDIKEFEAEPLPTKGF